MWITLRGTIAMRMRKRSALTAKGVGARILNKPRASFHQTCFLGSAAKCTQNCRF